VVAFLVYDDVVAVRGGGGGGAPPLTGGRGGGDVSKPFEGVVRGGGGGLGGGTDRGGGGGLGGITDRGGGGGVSSATTTFAFLCTAAAGCASKLLASISLTWMGLSFHLVLPPQDWRRHRMNDTSVKGLLAVFHTKLKVGGLKQEVWQGGDPVGNLPGVKFC